MLQSITIRQVALIDECTIEFHDGLQVLTGETGAGKSIVVDSVNLILGGRADRELIRTGCDKATVEAVFDVPGNETVQRFMEEEEIEYDGRTVTVYREISQNGRNICRVCGVPIPAAKLKGLASVMMDLHGQSEHQFLADPEMHLGFLDQTGDEEHQKLLETIKTDYESFISNHRAYAKLVKQGERREERMASLEKDLEQLRKANLQPGEAEKLQEAKKRLQAAEKEAAMLRKIDEYFSGENIDGSNSLSRIKSAAAQLKDLAGQNAEIAGISERCSNLYFELEEIAYEISNMIDRTEADPALLEKTENRLDLIRRLERKYGMEADEINRMKEKLEEEYNELNGLEERIGEMAKEHRQLLARYRSTAKALTASRKELARTFENRMTGELKDLGMENTRFEVLFRPNESDRPQMPTATGDDRIEFMISPNPGEPLKPLAKIASGGELSRLMLAIKTLEAAHTGVESMVFDEIDTGISGRMAQVVAEKMIAISGNHQVICVTHLPQIAAAADYQYLVRKATAGGRTNTFVTELDKEGRKEEVARMISGADGITTDAMEYAEGMLKAAGDIKGGSGGRGF
jgi:DNA repair protein RecN (Recombination protein N)